MNQDKLAKVLPWAAGGLAVALALAAMVPPGPVRGFDVQTFAKLPVLEGGREKPMDSIARNSLLMLRSKGSVQVDDGKGGTRTAGATEWLLDVLFRPEVADTHKAFVIDDPDLLSLVGQSKDSGRYHAFNEIAPHLSAVEEQARLAQPIDAKKRTRFQGAVSNLYERLWLYRSLKNTMQPERGPSLPELVAGNDPSTAAMLAATGHFRVLPPPAAMTEDRWRSVGEALRDGRGADADPGLAMLARMSDAWRTQDAPAFNAAVAAFAAHAEATRPAAASHAGHESLFNRAEPFYLGMVVYVLALVLLFASWLWWPKVLQPTAFALLVAGAVIHTAGLASRVILQGRPPVTNLYSSAVFVGWGAVILGVIVERYYRKGFGTAVAAASGFASLIVAHHLSGDGDTMEMMRAVLDSNFWLATHVVTITIGYSGTFLAGAIAIAYGIRKHVAPRLDPATTKALVGMTYGIICFALFFSFLGTVLGGIWADQSWGRFWGWDPKENGALLIVLWNAIILHARWGGYARDDGIMTMAIFGNVITALSWFGVNMLGVGLHSYGFMDKAFWALAGFCGAQLALMALTFAPRRFWSASAPAPEGGEQGAKA